MPITAGTSSVLSAPVYSAGAEFDRALERVPRIDDAPGHRRRAGTVRGDEARGMRARLAIEDVVDVALAIERDVARLVPRHLDIAHAREQRLELRRLGMGELDEFEPVGAGGVVGADRGGRCVVRERTHGDVLECIADCHQYLAHRARKSRAKSML